MLRLVFIFTLIILKLNLYTVRCKSISGFIFNKIEVFSAKMVWYTKRILYNLQKKYANNKEDLFKKGHFDYIS